jgi:hypothetical protein
MLLQRDLTASSHVKVSDMLLQRGLSSWNYVKEVACA